MPAAPWGVARLLRTEGALLLILLFGAYFRLQYIDLPMAEAHSWRQITNADITRNFVERSLNIFYPQVSWGGPGEAYVGMEFPLLQWLAAVLVTMFGEHIAIYRGLAIAFSLATIVGLYGLGRCLWDAAVGRGAAFLFAISPSAIFFGRTFISDTPMICFSVFGVWGFAEYLKSGRRSPLVWGAATAALACLVKVPAVLIFAPIAILALQTRGWGVLRDRLLIGGAAAALLLTTAWYVHADVLFHRTGLGQAIWHPSGGYAPEILVGARPMRLVSHWSTAAQLRDPEFYTTIVQRTWNLHLGPVAMMVALFGAAVLWRIPGRLFVDAWCATVLLFILVSAEGQRWHEFHQLPLLLPAALYFGWAARPAFDGGWLRQHGPRPIVWAGSAGVLVLAGVMTVYYSGVVPHFFRPHALDLRIVHAGHAIQAVTPPDALLVTVDYYEFGANSPMLLYHARRRGWSFDAASITPHVVRNLRSRKQVRYFATLIWSELVERHPDLVEYLEAQHRIPLNGPGDVALFELR